MTNHSKIGAYGVIPFKLPQLRHVVEVPDLSVERSQTVHGCPVTFLEDQKRVKQAQGPKLRPPAPTQKLDVVAGICNP